MAVKIVRLNILDGLQTVQLIFFKSNSTTPSTSTNLGLSPRGMTIKTQLLYKWAMPALRELRYSVEKTTGQAIDMTGNTLLTRNELLFESAVPLAKLYDELLVSDDTFVLQEFFVPQKRFDEWIELARPIYQDLANQSVLLLLNTTIRYVLADKITALPYAREDCYAFVLYYRLPRTREADEALGMYHNRFAEATVSLNGTFYLPYRKCYSLDLMERSYPDIKAFAGSKRLFDPANIFTNAWYNKYLEPLLPPPPTTSIPPSSAEQNLPAQPALEAPPPPPAPRTGSYRKLLSDPLLRARFRHEFLVNIFSLVDSDIVITAMTKAALDPLNATDFEIFKSIKAALSSGSSPLKPLKSILQLHRQKKELVRETLSLFHKVGRTNLTNSYVSLGDNGKVMLPLSKALDIKSPMYQGHDKPCEADDVASVLERGSLSPVADAFFLFDYISKDEAWLSHFDFTVPDGTVELITMNQGLHHIPPDRLFAFLRVVLRKLCYGGIFLVREHDLSSEVPIEMLDLAHSVFNALTDVSDEDEVSEIRAFRSIAE